MASLSLQSLHKSFGAVAAVQDVSLNVNDGDFISLLGPSGCGKTTTLRMVAGLEMSDSGRILIEAQDVTHRSPRERDIAMVFQDYALYPHMTVLENVGYPLRVRGVSGAEIRRRVEQVAGQLQIETLLDRRPGQLSGGQQQRVALARAVVHRARITLYDEPLSNLDTKLRIEARTFLKHLQQEVGLTSLYVTHDQAEAMALSDQIVVMNQGKVMQVGTPMQIYREPSNVFVASFIGSPAMNLFDCQIDHQSNQLRIEGVASLPLGVLPHADGLKTLSAVRIGIRPEHITLHATPQAGRLPASLYVIQELGSETLAIFKVNQQFVAVRLVDDGITSLPSQQWLVLQPARIFLYGQDGDRIQ